MSKHQDEEPISMKKQYYPLFLIVLVVSTLVACARKEEYILPKNAIELLAGTSGKSWKLAKRMNNNTRMNMRGCFLSYRVTYHPHMLVTDNNGEQENCGLSLEANWDIIKGKKAKSYIKWTGDQLPELLNIKENYKYFKILKLTRDTLKLQHRHKQFSSASTFVDILVPENVNIKDRDFHW